MSEEQVRRRRRRRRRGGGGQAAEREVPTQAVAERRAPALAGWQWRTFPVFFAFVLGGFLILLIGPEPNTSLYTILFFVFLGASAFGVAHIVTRAVIARRRR